MNWKKVFGFYKKLKTKTKTQKKDKRKNRSKAYRSFTNHRNASRSFPKPVAASV